MLPNMIMNHKLKIIIHKKIYLTNRVNLKKKIKSKIKIYKIVNSLIKQIQNLLLLNL